jgi:hypothetical protein
VFCLSPGSFQLISRPFKTAPPEPQIAFTNLSSDPADCNKQAGGPEHHRHAAQQK